MSWPTNAERAGWFAQQFERPMPLEGHVPAYTMLAAGQYIPTCRCGCLGDDPGLLQHGTWFEALDDARAILTTRIHGDAS